MNVLPQRKLLETQQVVLKWVLKQNSLPSFPLKIQLIFIYFISHSFISILIISLILPENHSNRKEKRIRKCVHALPKSTSKKWVCLHFGLSGITYTHSLLGVVRCFDLRHLSSARCDHKMFSLLSTW